MRKATGSYRIYSSLVKLQSRFVSLQWKNFLGRIAALVPEFAVKDMPLGRTHDDDDDDDVGSIAQYTISSRDFEEYTVGRSFSLVYNLSRRFSNFF